MRVIAVNEAGDGPPSGEATATPETAEAEPNSPATGAPAITGTGEGGRDADWRTPPASPTDGLTNATFGYQWRADDADIPGATGSTYTLADADEGKTIKVRVSFTDDAGNDESLTSAATEPVEAKPNSPATGTPIISGTAQVGETLTVDTSGIADANGLDDAAFSYQWLADDVEVQGATEAAYTLVSSDEGKTIKARVSFTDDAGNQETLTSACDGGGGGGIPGTAGASRYGPDRDRGP